MYTVFANKKFGINESPKSAIPNGVGGEYCTHTNPAVPISRFQIIPAYILPYINKTPSALYVDKKNQPEIKKLDCVVF